MHFFVLGRSDFVRFGRDSGKYNRPNSNFLRFGRSIDSNNKVRNKREIYNEDYGNRELKRQGSNFVRFGRRNDNFMRFGRAPEEEPTTPVSPSFPHKTFIERQSPLDGRYGQIRESPLLLLLSEMVLKMRQNNEKLSRVAD